MVKEGWYGAKFRDKKIIKEQLGGSRRQMEYENGKAYTFKFGDCVANVRLKSFSPKLKENFNKQLATELCEAYRKEKGDSWVSSPFGHWCTSLSSCTAEEGDR